MTEKSYFAGFGGQGIISLGQIWVYCGIAEGNNVTFFPFYGAEKRGGIARASVIVSDEEIDSPLVTRANSALVMNPDSFALCENLLMPGGKLLINSSLVSQECTRTDLNVLRLPLQEMAEKLGNAMFANMVALGAMAKFTGALKLDKAQEILSSFFPETKHKFIPLNLAAINAGLSAL